MKKKGLLVGLLAVLCLCAFAACDAKTAEQQEIVPREALAMPEQVRVDDGKTVRWQAVENAEKYEVAYFCAETDDASVTTAQTAETSMDLAVDAPGYYAVRVRALAAADSFYARSPWSDWVDFKTGYEFLLDAPAGVKAEKRLVTWQSVGGATGYRVQVDGEEAIETRETKYALPSPVPGETYSVRVQAVGDSYYKDSPWSQACEFLYEVSYAAPENVRLDTDGYLKWDAVSDLYDGYVVAVKKVNAASYTEYKVGEESFDVAALGGGDYTAKVKVSGGSAQYDSPYSADVTGRISVAVEWDATAIANSFAAWNYCSAAVVGTGENAYASLRCGKGWGGRVSPQVEVNFDRNPVFVVSYPKVEYGYMGNFYYPTLYTYAPDIRGSFENLVLHYPMHMYQGNTIPEAQGVVKSQVSIGFTHAPEANDSREVMRVKYARIVYVEDIPVVPDEPQPLRAPESLSCDGYTISWKASAGNSDYTPRYRVEIERENGGSYETVKTLTDYTYTNYDLRNIENFALGTYRFRVTALGDDLYFADSVATVSSSYRLAQKTYTVDLQDFATNAVAGGHISTPVAKYEDGKLVLTQQNSYGMLRYVLPENVDVQSAVLHITFDEVTGGNYYIRMPLAVGGDPNNTGCIVSHDSHETGARSWNLNEVETLKNLDGSHSLALHLGLSGTAMRCVISNISLTAVSVTAVE